MTEQELSIGECVTLRGVGVTPVMRIISPVMECDDWGNRIASVRVFWFDDNSCPHDRMLPVAVLEKVG